MLLKKFRFEERIKKTEWFTLCHNLSIITWKFMASYKSTILIHFVVLVRGPAGVRNSIRTYIYRKIKYALGCNSIFVNFWGIRKWSKVTSIFYTVPNVSKIPWWSYFSNLHIHNFDRICLICGNKYPLHDIIKYK